VVELTAEFARSRLKYDPDTGEFFRLTKTGPAKAGDSAGSLQSRGYIRISLNYKYYLAHRLAWLLTYGVWPKGQIDHINGDRQDNRIANLREVDQLENNKNMGLRRDNRTGLPGVSQHAKGGWTASVFTGGKNTHIGYSKDFFEVVCMRKSAELSYGFHANHGRR
jgi:hypothetical protein